MQVIESIQDLSKVGSPIHLGVGVFDGVHPGHRTVIRSAIDQAALDGGSAVVLTFDPHPAKVLRPNASPRLLTSTPHKIRLIANMGVPWMLKIHFDIAFAKLDPSAFIESLVQSANPLRSISVGHDWGFGRGRAGNVALLKKLGAQCGFDVIEIAPVQVDGQTISSTRIRNAIESGDLDLAARCLGRKYSIFGSVQRGDQLGRTLGFPTANLHAHNEQFPPNGVYAVRVTHHGRCLAGVANIGVRPTLGLEAPARRLEVHIFDFDEMLYDQDIEVEFQQFIREEIRFSTIDALKQQIQVDTAAARQILVA